MSKDYQEKWGIEETHIAVKMLEDGAMLREISERLGRTYEGVRKMFKRKKIRPNRTLSAIRVEARKARDRRASHIVKPASKTVAPHLIAEREARLDEPRTIGMQQFGDPPPSQSALMLKQKLGSGPHSAEPSRPGSAPAVGATIQRE